MGNEALPLASVALLLLLLAALVALASSAACVVLAAGVTTLLVAFAASADVALLTASGTAASTLVMVALLMLRAARTPGNAGVSAAASACPATGLSNAQLRRQITASTVVIRISTFLPYEAQLESDQTSCCKAGINCCNVNVVQQTASCRAKFIINANQKQ
jgi:hypothetical protein